MRQYSQWSALIEKFAKMTSNKALFLAIWWTMVEARNYKIGLIVPTGPEFVESFAWETGASATTIAIEKIEADPNLLPGDSFSVVWVLANCNPRIGTGLTVDLRYVENVDLFMGAPCSLVAVPAGHLASYWNLPFVAWVSRDPKLADKTEFTTMARIMGPLNKVGNVCAEMFRHFGWKVSVIVYAETLDDVCTYAANAVQSSFRGSNISVGDTIKLLDLNAMSEEDIDGVFLKIKQRGRIVVLCNRNPEEERQFLLWAHDRGMAQGDYVYVVLNKLFADERSLKKPWEFNDNRDVDAYYAYEAVLEIIVERISNDEIDNFFDLIPVKMAEPPFNHTLPAGTRGNIYSPYLHDAVLMYAIALNKTLQQGFDARDGKTWLSNVKGLRFEGMTGSVVMDENGDREPVFWIMDLRSSGEMEKVAESHTRENGERVFELSNLPIWGKGENGAILDTPRDRPECGFFDEYCERRDNTVLIVTVTVIVVLAICSSVTAVLVYRMRFRQDVSALLWQIRSEEVTISHKHTSLLGSISSKSSALMQSEADRALTTLAIYQGVLCAVKKLHVDVVNLSKEDVEELKSIRNMNHENVNKFYGACFEQSNNFLLTAYCPKGSLEDILENEDIKLDWMFKISFISDLIEGIHFIQKSVFGSHGNLKSTNCVVDKKWVLKLTDFGCGKLRSKQSQGIPEHEHGSNAAISDELQNSWRKLLWTAPELLRDVNRPYNGTKAGDIYSFGMILQEITQRRGVFPTEKHMFAKDIVNRVRSGETPPFRPDISPMLCEPEMSSMIHNCLTETPDLRPSCDAIRRRLLELNNGKKPNVLDNLLQKMERYADNLEDLVEARTKELVEEKKKTDMLLYRMLPPSVADQLKAGKTVHPESYDQVSIFFSDIVGFTLISSHSSPMQVVDLLNDLYTLFDEIIEQFDVYKVETIGDAYMVVSGLPKRNDARHAAEIANMALAMLDQIKSTTIRHMPGATLQLRIGVHTGPCAAGVVGLSMPRYCLFGDTVNVASRMESTGEALKIHCSQWTYNVLGLIGGYRLKPRGEVDVQGKGKMNTFWLIGKEDNGYIKTGTQKNGLQQEARLSSSTRGTPVGCQAIDNISIQDIQ
ncbi:atrial natriuretic peptide receptor 1-like [Ptychodera flava]|uniref:atrial natriuretic peptide receptor 1-like n=1 Tax=Ptychodera flava TaxID=63121 RepID=UPI003969BD51